MDATDTYVPEPKAVTLESAVRIINFWRDRAIAAEAEAAELRERLAEAQLKTDEARKAVRAQFKRSGRLEQQLATVTALVPEARLLQRVAGYANIHTIASQSRVAPRDEVQLLELAADIRAWREGKPAATIEVTDGYCDPGNASLPVGKWAVGSWICIDIPHSSEDDDGSEEREGERNDD